MHHPQTVRYSQLLTKPVVGQRCLLVPLDHPSNRVSNVNPAYTSPVTWIGKGGHVFHTENSRYVPTTLGSDEFLNEDNPGSIIEGRYGREVK